jgi:glycosyltransferase involved in cell wall biosynthesis
VLKNGDYYIVQSAMDEEDLLSIRPEAICRKTVMPSFNAFKLQNLTREEGRKLLRIEPNTKVLLFFGFVREYKGLKHLLRAMPKVISKLGGVKLLVVGDFANDKQDYLDIIAELQIENCIEIYDGYIPDKEVEKFFAASDVVVLPYESATQSGIVQIAYGFEKPVVATDVGGLPEVVIDGKTGYVVPPKNSEKLAEKIVEFYQEDKAEDFKEGIRQEAYKYSWDRMRETIEEMYGQDKQRGK